MRRLGLVHVPAMRPILSEEAMSRMGLVYVPAVRPKLNEEARVPFSCESQHFQCYQLLGFDVMIDDDYKMWLLECNAKPCMDWEKEEIDQTVGPAVNTEVMAIALSLGLNAGKSDISSFASPLLLERTIPVNTVYSAV